MLQNHTAKAAIYARRSPEDRANRQNQFRGDGVSDSIETQILMLQQYADNQGFTNCREYYDDNISGTTFSRPQFMQMLNDIQQGRIDTVIVKDLSRLGRDYIESGRYQEIVFPELGTRLIAINDGYDSATGAGTDCAVFKNVFNDYYVKDISNKTRSALAARARAGKYLSSGIYGYQKDPENKNQLLPDPETAPVVRRIYSMVVSGVSFRSISRTLSAEGMTTIKLNNYYPHLTECISMEVSEEIAVVLSTGGRQCDSYKRRKREHNECSLDVDPGFEPDVMFPPLTPEEIILEEENRSALYAALDQLPPIQARRVYAHYILGKKKSEIARAENVEGSAVCDSIRRGLKNLSELLKNFH